MDAEQAVRTLKQHAAWLRGDVLAPPSTAEMGEAHRAAIAALRTRALTQAQPGWRVPEGYALVPEIATEAMVEAIIDQGRHGGDEISHTTAHMIWADAVIAWQHRANRAAAPAPQQGEG